MGSPHLFHHHPIMAGVWVATWALWIDSRDHPFDTASFRKRRAESGSRIEVRCARVGISWHLSRIHCCVLCSQPLRGNALEGRLCPRNCRLARRNFPPPATRFASLAASSPSDVAIAKGHRIVEQGPYRWLRHPSYLGQLAGQVGFGMTLTNWLAMLLPVCCLAAAYAYRIPIEEQALLRGLGSDYSDYMRRTWRLIPFVY